MNGYKTLRGPASAELTEKRSVFICRVRPVTTEAQALAFLAEVRKQCADARHNVYAYTIRENGIARFSDDGEPHGTAGLPTLDALRKRGIVDAAAVTTRYFGGVLLGTGGLVRAYSQAAAMAVEQAGVAEMAACAFFFHRRLADIRACRRWPTVRRRCGSSGLRSATA
ncbi:MAG: IMPACT family protein [Acutalibacteraceae bacterium]